MSTFDLIANSQAMVDDTPDLTAPPYLPRPEGTKSWK